MDIAWLLERWRWLEVGVSVVWAGFGRISGVTRSPPVAWIALANYARAARLDDLALEVVVLTGEPSTGAMLAALRGRVFDFLQKPALLRDVAEVVVRAHAAALRRRLWRDSSDVALPHLKCSRPGFGGNRHEADQHDNTGRIGGEGDEALSSTAITVSAVAGRSAHQRCSAVSGERLARHVGSGSAVEAGEVRPTSKPKKKVTQYWRRCPDPLESVSAQLRGWFEAEPWRTSRELLERLQGEHPGVYPDGQLRTVQRRVKAWRREVAHTLVFGAPATDERAPSPAPSPLQCVT